MTKLSRLRVDKNPLSGPLPPELRHLERIASFFFNDTDLCVPENPSLQAWLDGIADYQPSTAAGAPPSAAVPSDDVTRNVLITFFNATGGPNWKRADNWLSDAPVGSWYGVTTDAQGSVTGLALPRNGLAGSIPAHLQGLSDLTVLNLSRNPGLTGPIPPQLGNLSNLVVLDAHRNRLAGTLPPEVFNSDRLTFFSISYNQVEGPIPPEVGNAVNLRRLHLDSNRLSGTLPPELGKLDKMVYLAPRVNSLTGRIPPELGDLPDLVHLGLQSNSLSGPLPPQLGHLTNLDYLRLAYNGLLVAPARYLPRLEQPGEFRDPGHAAAGSGRPRLPGMAGRHRPRAV